jgi:hypothetical protein
MDAHSLSTATPRAIVLLPTAAFIASGWIRPPFCIWWRRAVIIGYLLALGLVLVWITTWHMGFLQHY